MTYRFALGYNQTTGFIDLVVQPKMDGISWPSNSENFSGSGLVYRDGGKTAALSYTFLTKRNYNQLLEDLNLIQNESVPITIYLPRNEDRVFARHNAIIKKPNHPKDGKLKYDIWENVVFEIYNIRVI